MRSQPGGILGLTHVGLGLRGPQKRPEMLDQAR